MPVTLFALTFVPVNVVEDKYVTLPFVPVTLFALTFVPVNVVTTKLVKLILFARIESALIRVTSTAVPVYCVEDIRLPVKLLILAFVPVNCVEYM